MAIDSIEASLKVSEDFLTALDQLIKTQILASWIDKLPGVDAIARNLDALVAKAETALKNAEAAIRSQIEPLIKNAIPNALDFLTSLTNSLDTHLTQLIGNIATTEDVLGAAINELRKQSPHLASWIYDNVAGSFGNIALGVLRTIETENPEAIDPLLDELLKLPNLPPWLQVGVASARERKAPFFAFLLPALLLAALLPALGAMTEPITTDIRQEAFANLPTVEAETGVILSGFFRNLIDVDRFKARMSHHGFNEDVAQLYLETARELLTPDVLTRAYIRGDIDKETWERGLATRGMTTDQANTLWQSSVTLLGDNDARTAWLRSLVDDAGHDRMLSRLGYDEDAAKLRRQLYFFIPPVQDIIHMGIRNVFNPAIVERFTLSGDYPKPFEDAARQQGVSPEWALKYWQAHWIMPGREAFFEMFQRTVDKPLDENADEIRLSDGTVVYNIMGKETLNLALRDIDTPPFYRDKLTQVAYRPITRIDIRRLESVGLLDFAGVERAYLDLGYNHTNALRLAHFTQALNARVKKDEAATLVDGIRKQALRLYVQGKLTDADIDSTLTDLRFTPAEVEVFKTEALLVARADRVNRIETRIGKLYIAGIIDGPEAEKRLIDHDIPTAAITQLFSEWNLDIEYKGGSEHIHKHRDLTKAEVVESLVDGFIDSDTALNMVMTLGYDVDGAEAEINLALYRQAKAAKKSQIDAIRASYVNGTIEQIDASNRLDALIVPGEQRDAYLSEWSLQRETRTERIPMTTLKDMLQGGYIEVADAFSHLKRHRFTDADATLLLQFWQNQKPPKGLVHA